MSKNRNLKTARKTKNDEFYTQYSDIAKELPNYKEQLANKIVYCNCDNPKYSNFYKYLKANFHKYNLKSLTTTYFSPDSHTFKTTFDGQNEIVTPLGGHGDFRSPVCISILQESDIIITNPPFSLFRKFIDILTTYNIQFLILGNVNAITYKEVFLQIVDNKLKLGFNRCSSMLFKSIDSVGCISIKARWFTNLDINTNFVRLNLTKRYNINEYPYFDNYNAINVDKTKDIPYDYDGYIGVPITFLDKYNSEQFRIVDALNRYSLLDIQNTNESVMRTKSHSCNIDGKPKYFRIIIKRIK